MGRPSMNRDFRNGLRRALPIVISAAPFALLFGALAVDNGLSVMQAVLVSATIFAGASQMVGIELFGNEASPWLIGFSIFVVNARHLLYSATSGRRMRGFTPLQRAVAFFFMTDPHFAETEREAERAGGFSFRWCLGLGLGVYLSWVGITALGAIFGRQIPDARLWGIDFLLTIYFLGLVMGFRRRAFWLPVVLVSAAASVLAFRVVGSPWHVSLGALAGVIFAALCAVPRDRGQGTDV